MCLSWNKAARRLWGGLSISSWVGVLTQVSWIWRFPLHSVMTRWRSAGDVTMTLRAFIYHHNLCGNSLLSIHQTPSLLIKVNAYINLICITLHQYVPFERVILFFVEAEESHCWLVNTAAASVQTSPLAHTLTQLTKSLLPPRSKIASINRGCVCLILEKRLGPHLSSLLPAAMQQGKFTLLDESVLKIKMWIIFIWNITNSKVLVVWNFSYKDGRSKCFNNLPHKTIQSENKNKKSGQMLKPFVAHMQHTYIMKTTSSQSRAEIAKSNNTRNIKSLKILK